VKTVTNVVCKGFRCSSAFAGMWVFAYAVPTLIYLVSPDTIASVEGYAWMGLEEWSRAALMSLIGFTFFGLGYRLGKRIGVLSRGASRFNITHKNTFAQLTFLVMALGLQLYPVCLILSRGIKVDFAHRAVHWREVGLTIRFAYFCLPSTAIAFSLFVEKKSLTRLVLLALSISVSVISAVILGARMFLVLLPVVLFLIYSTRNPRARIQLLIPLLVIVIVLSVGYYALLRADDPGDLRKSFFHIFVCDLGRMHTLAYTSGHVSLVHSDLVNPPMLGSYFYWLILPVPRSSWSAKPYATNLQFSFHFRREHTSFYVPADIVDFTGRNEFGFIEEAMLNLGFAGFLLVASFGYLAARIDNQIRYGRYLRVAVLVFFLVGTIYTFNGILNYLAPLLIAGLVLDRIPYGQIKRRRQLANCNTQGNSV